MCDPNNPSFLFISYIFLSNLIGIKSAASLLAGRPSKVLGSKQNTHGCQIIRNVKGDNQPYSATAANVPSDSTTPIKKKPQVRLQCKHRR
jgi:hypothetical protein